MKTAAVSLGSVGALVDRLREHECLGPEVVYTPAPETGALPLPLAIE